MPPSLLSDSTLGSLREPIEVTRAIMHQQDEEYADSLRRDQERERIRVENNEEEARKLRIEEWYKRIRDDMKGSVTPEPAEGLDGVVHIRVRLPNGQRVSRRFNGSDDVKSSLLLLDHRSASTRDIFVCLSVTYPIGGFCVMRGHSEQLESKHSHL
ncbi:uncharacterized protein LOC135345748 [Halichondria panicea]|uniref:uncharacterized protein LOC135345748 n=1 Tax=Halichondria panicea TaxID=6063 RepID=UPI00312B3F6B